MCHEIEPVLGTRQLESRQLASVGRVLAKSAERCPLRLEASYPQAVRREVTVGAGLELGGACQARTILDTPR